MMEEIQLLDLSNIVESALLSDDEFVNTDSSYYTENYLEENFRALAEEYGEAFVDEGVGESCDPVDMDIDDDIITDIELSCDLSEILDMI